MNSHQYIKQMTLIGFQVGVGQSGQRHNYKILMSPSFVKARLRDSFEVRREKLYVRRDLIGKYTQTKQEAMW